MTVAGYFLPRHYHSECHKSEWGATLVCDCMCVCVCVRARARAVMSQRLIGSQVAKVCFVCLLEFCVCVRALTYKLCTHSEEPHSLSLSLSLSRFLSLASSLSRSLARSLALVLSHAHANTRTQSLIVRTARRTPTRSVSRSSARP